MKGSSVGVAVLVFALVCFVNAQIQTPCLKGNFTGVRCGDCKEATYTIKPTEGTGLSSVRCIKCHYYAPNGRDLVSTHEFEDIGKYGCTWAKVDFFKEHPLLLLLVLLATIVLGGFLTFLFYHSHKHSVYRMHPKRAIDAAREAGKDVSKSFGQKSSFVNQKKSFNGGEADKKQTKTPQRDTLASRTPVQARIITDAIGDTPKETVTEKIPSRPLSTDSKNKRESEVREKLIKQSDN